MTTDDNTDRPTSRLLERLDDMVRAGRISPEEAEQVRAAGTSGDPHEVVGEIRLRHARAAVAAAVEDGRLTQDQADSMIEQVKDGELPRFLRELRREGLLRGRQDAAAAGTDPDGGSQA